MRKLTIVVGLGAFPVTIVGGPEIEDEVPRPSRVEAQKKNHLVRSVRNTTGPGLYYQRHPHTPRREMRAVGSGTKASVSRLCQHLPHQAWHRALLACT